MKVSTAAIRFVNEHYGSAGDPAPSGVDALVQKIGAQLGAVEETIDFGKRFERVIIVKVITCEGHPDADRLHICKVDDGGTAQGVERDENGHVQIVCGAPNVRAGMWTAWLPPGSTVPNTLDTADPFVLEARPLRGVVSNGMMASPRELTLGDGHEGILEVTEDFGTLTPGTLFADYYHLRNDVIIDIENKMFTHRPDCFGWLGLAREIEGIQHRAYKSPDWYTLDPDIPDVETEELKLEVRNELPELVPRFTAITLRNVQVGPSPVWLQVDLARAGIRPINNIVDYTNWYMVLTGQPLHAYDYDKVRAQDQGAEHATIVIRRPHPGEKLKLLGGKTIEPREDAVMIATRGKSIGLGGVMGGADTEVDEHTTNIILECANFDMYSVRRTAMHHGLFTDAATRFTKGQSPLQNLAVLAKIVDEIRRFAGGKVASGVIDDKHLTDTTKDTGSVHGPITVETAFINTRLGLNLSYEEMAALLTNVEFHVHDVPEGLCVQAPFWRTDIAIPEDIVEEVGRLYGYDRLALELPRRDLTPTRPDPVLTLKARVRETLAAAGANELLTYSFVHDNLLDKVGQDRAQAFQIANALSPDLQYYRLSLTPSLLEKVHSNLKAGHPAFALFELGKAHHVNVYEDDLPREFERIALVFAAEPKTAEAQFAGAPYYQARKYATTLLAHFGATEDVQWRPLRQATFGDHQVIEQMTKPFDPARSAVLVKGDLIVGVVGEYRASVRKALKLPDFAAGFELFHSLLQKAAGVRYTPLPRFPKLEQDICLKVPAETPYTTVYQFVWDKLAEVQSKNALPRLNPVDIYQRQDDPDHKRITLRLSVASFERTLTDQEVGKLLDHVAEAAKAELRAERI